MKVMPLRIETMAQDFSGCIADSYPKVYRIRMHVHGGISDFY